MAAQFLSQKHLSLDLLYGIEVLPIFRVVLAVDHSALILAFVVSEHRLQNVGNYKINGVVVFYVKQQKLDQSDSSRVGIDGHIVPIALFVSLKHLIRHVLFGSFVSIIMSVVESEGKINYNWSQSILRRLILHQEDIRRFYVSVDESDLGEVRK